MDAVTKKTYALLNSVATSTDPQAGVKFLTTKQAATAVAAGHLQVNKKVKDTAGSFAHRLTDNGKTFLASIAPAPAGDADGDDAPTVDPGSLPKSLTGTNGTFSAAALDLPEPTNVRKSGYPSDDLAAPFKGDDGKIKYHSIFIPPKPGVDATKAFPAIASAANKRWADKTPIRKFTSRVMDGGDFDPKYKGVTGVGIFRIE